MREGQDFRHYIGQLIRRVDVCKVHNILVTPVSDNVVFDIDMLGALGCHVIRGHADSRLVIFTKQNGFV